MNLRYNKPCGDCTKAFGEKWAAIKLIQLRIHVVWFLPFITVTALTLIILRIGARLRYTWLVAAGGRFGLAECVSLAGSDAF